VAVDVWFLRIREPYKRSTVAAAPSDFHGDSFVRKARLDGVSNQCPRVVWWNAGYFNQVRLGIARSVPSRMNLLMWRSSIAGSLLAVACANPRRAPVEHEASPPYLFNRAMLRLDRAAG